MCQPSGGKRNPILREELNQTELIVCKEALVKYFVISLYVLALASCSYARMCEIFPISAGCSCCLT